MAEHVWTVDDTRRMLKGLPFGVALPQSAGSAEQGSSATPKPPRTETEGDASPPLPPDAVSATIETVDEQPTQTVEVVQTIAPRAKATTAKPAVPRRRK